MYVDDGWNTGSYADIKSRNSNGGLAINPGTNTIRANWQTYMEPNYVMIGGYHAARSFKYDSFNQAVFNESGYISYYNFSENGPGGNYNCGIQSVLFNDPKYGWQMVGTGQGGDKPTLNIRKIENNAYKEWYKVWGEFNHGGGSGLDAEMVDGVQGYDIVAANRTGEYDDFNKYTDNGIWKLDDIHGKGINNRPTDAYGWGCIRNQQFANSNYIIQEWIPHQYEYWIRCKWNGGWTEWRQVWTSLNDGSGSGLDADTLDGINSSQFVRRDVNNQSTY